MTNRSILCMIEGGAALHFINERPKQTIRFDKNIINENPFKIMELTK